jgi:MFS family permease
MPLVGLGVGALAAGLAAWKVDSLSFLALNALLFIVNFGVGAMLPVATVSVQNAVLARDLGTATATTQFFRQLGAAVIVALFAALALGGGRAAYIAETRLTPEELTRLLGSFRLVFAALAVCMGLSFAFMARMEELPLRGERRH